MSLVTRCPACATTFKVVRDQLRISDGWVRCGRCSHVFDATLDLHEAPDGASPPPTSPVTAQGGHMPGLVEPSNTAAATTPPAVSEPVATSPEPPTSLPVEAPAAPPEEAPAPAPEDADFFDDEQEAPSASASASSQPLASPAFTLALPEHGLVADEPWADLDATEPACPMVLRCPRTPR